MRIKFNLSVVYPVLFLLTLVLTIASTGKIYNGVNKGIAWQHGGLRLSQFLASFYARSHMMELNIIIHHSLICLSLIVKGFYNV